MWEMSGNNYAHVKFSIKIEKKIQTKEKLHMNYYVGRRGEFFKKKESHTMLFDTASWW